jgi:acetyltransferase
VRVREVADLFHAAEVLDSRRLPTGPEVAIIANAGGLAVMATDALMEAGGRLAKLSEKTMEKLNAALPPTGATATPSMYLGTPTAIASWRR